MTPDPYAPHLHQADDLFARGEFVKAGQIWQAILKQQPTHATARERLQLVKQRLLALRETEAAAAPTLPENPATPPPTPEPVPAEPVPPIALLVQTLPDPPATPTPALAPPIALTAPTPPLPASAPPGSPATSEALPWSTDPEEVSSPPPPPRVSTGSLDPDRLLTEGCTLYDMGQIEDALRKWEQVLVLAPTHTLARGYASGARRELGLPPLPDSAVPTPAQPEARLADEDADKLMREAVQLYDMGLAEEAISKWERVLVLEPHRQEVEGYLKMARREVSQVPAPPTVPTRSAVPEPDSLDLKLRQAEHLLTLQRHEEAAFTFQQALRLSPGDARALQGLERCRKPSTGPSQDHTLVIRTPAPAMVLDSRGRIAMADEDSHPPVQTDGQGIEPPAALLKAAPAPREGLSLPNRFREATEHLHWLKHPKVLAILGGSLLVLAVGASLLHGYRKDQALREQVLAARAAALAPVAQQAQAPDLSESMEALREEADLALVSDPLRAFLRAQTLVARSPGDAAGALLLEKARAGLPGGVTGSSLAEFQKHLQNGDLEAALKVMDALLRAQPDNAELKARAGRLHLALCVAHAGQAKWDEAREDLLRGRALFPSDKTWQIRFKLLERIKTMPKAEQASWISLLG